MATKDAGKLVLETLLKHTAECFEALVRIIADKYGHDANEMMEAVAGDARWTSLKQPEMFKALGEYSPPAPPVPVKPCVLCGGDAGKHGNNPAPLAETGVCCDACNLSKVVPARLALSATPTAPAESKKTIKRVIKVKKPVAHPPSDNSSG
jgi:hypothetical protein